VHGGETFHRTGQGIGTGAARRFGEEIELHHPATGLAHQANAAAAQARCHRIGRGEGEEHRRHRIHRAALGLQGASAGTGRQWFVRHRDTGILGFTHCAGGIGVRNIVPQTNRRGGMIAKR
jgi:hypothetical protein